MGVSQGQTFKMEIVTVSIAVSGSNVMSINGSGTFKNHYNNPPLVAFANTTQTVPYVDCLINPFINSVTTTGFSVNFKTAYLNGAQDYFGTGTFTTQFLVVGN